MKYVSACLGLHESPTYHLVDPVVFDQKYSSICVTNSPSKFFIHLFLRNSHLLRRILISIRTHFALLLWIEDECEPAWLQWFEYEA